MDIGTIITGIIIIVVCVALVQLMNRSNKSKKTRLQKALTEFAMQNGSTITAADSWFNGAIGIDDRGSKLFFLRIQKGESTNQMTDLSAIDKSYIIHATRSAGEKGELRVTDKLSLILVHTDKKKTDIAFEFYNAEYDSLRLTGEKELIEKWNEIVNRTIEIRKVAQQ